jgi:hypothetical protein
MSKYCHSCGNKAEESAKFCGGCGVEIGTLQNQSKNLTNKQTNGNPAINCPSCNRMDAVQTVATIVDSGTGSSIGFGLAGPLIPSHGHLMGGVMASSNSTAMASRLSGYSQPDVGISPGVQAGVWSGFITLLLILVTFPPTLSDGSSPTTITWVMQIVFMSIPSGIIGLIIGLIAVKPLRIAGNKKIQIARDKWVENFALMRRSKYCSRCDVVFSDYFSGTPEVYKDWCFSR